MGCGHYVEAYQDPCNAERSVEDFTSEMVAQVFEGAWGTEVRAGIIGEIGCQAGVRRLRATHCGPSLNVETMPTHLVERYPIAPGCNRGDH